MSKMKVTMALGITAVVVGAGFLLTKNHVKKTIKENQVKVEKSYHVVSNQYRRNALLLKDLDQIFSKVDGHMKFKNWIRKELDLSRDLISFSKISKDNWKKNDRYLVMLNKILRQGVKIAQRDETLKTDPMLKTLSKNIDRASIRIKVSQQTYHRTLRENQETLKKFPYTIVNR